MSLTDKTGYDLESKHIREKEAAYRKQLQQERLDAKKAQEKEAHWMKCPKCGSDMVEKEMDNVMIDQCTDCHGIYFDAGELDLILKREESKSFMDRIKGILK
ncbi:MAG: zf-TFIIB domain-containing protein [Lentisphaeraceae bacterium]|nr:zf-TFIIB domain-containing protein [Lentisphaeraceae bacterium]